MRDNFEITQTTSLFDFYKGAIYVWARHRKLRLFVFLPPLGVLVVGLMSILGSSKPGHESISVLLQVLLLLAFTIGFYLVGIFIILVLMRILRPTLFDNTKYTLNHWGMHKVMGAAEYSFPWKDFTRWKETKSFFLLFMKNYDGHIISKKILDEKEQQELREFLRERLTS